MISVSEENILFDQYLANVKAGLKGFDDNRQQEILDEIRSHLIDRVEQLKQNGSTSPAEMAISAMGDPNEISAQFLEADIVRRSAKSNFPWVLLRGAAHLALTGLRGTLLFLAGLLGYGIAIAFTLATLAKLIVPANVGFWIGPNTAVIWGYSANTLEAHELAGRWFAYISIALSFLFASGTTLLLKHLMSSGGHAGTRSLQVRD